MKYDEILFLIGEMGPYQIKIMILVALTIIPEAMNSMIAVLITAHMDSWCAVPEWSETAQDCTKLSLRSPEYLECIHKYRDASIPITDVIDGEPVYSECDMYDVEYPSEFSEGFFAGDWTNSTKECQDGWMFDQSLYKSTITSDFSLVCDRKYLAMTTQSIFYFGYLVGSFLSGSIADIIGRYYTLFLAVTIDFLAGFVLVFSPNVWFFCVFRFLVGVGNISIFLMSFVIATELLGSSKRSIGGISPPLVFGIGSMFLGVCGFLVRDWRYLQLLTACCLLPIYLLIPILPESARWLMAHKKIDKTAEIIRKIAKNNNTEHMLPENLDEGLMKEVEESAQDKTYTLLDVLRKPRLRLAALVFYFVWPVTALIYFGLSLNTAKFGSNPYLTFILSGFMEILASVLVIPLVATPLGRKYTIAGAIFLGGIACFITIFASGVFVTVTAMTGKLLISLCYDSLYIFTAEIYPTTVRSIGIGTSSTAARVGAILAPITLILGDTWEPLPLVTYGTLSVIAGILLLVTLPETRGRVLSATLEEGEEFLRNPDYRSVPTKSDEMEHKI